MTKLRLSSLLQGTKPHSRAQSGILRPEYKWRQSLELGIEKRDLIARVWVRRKLAFAIMEQFFDSADGRDFVQGNQCFHIQYFWLEDQCGDEVGWRYLGTWLDSTLSAGFQYMFGILMSGSCELGLWIFKSLPLFSFCLEKLQCNILLTTDLFPFTWPIHVFNILTALALALNPQYIQGWFLKETNYFGAEIFSLWMSQQTYWTWNWVLTSSQFEFFMQTCTINFVTLCRWHIYQPNGESFLHQLSLPVLNMSRMAGQI